MRIAVLGLGIIGSRAALHLQRNPARQVALWNRTPKGLPGEESTLASAVTDATTVLLYLKDAPAVRSVVGELLDSTAVGLKLVNHSTVDLPTTLWLQETCAGRGWRFLDAPFTGSRDAAGAAGLLYYVAGESELIDELEPLLLETGKAIVRCGPVGRATIIKLVTNLVSACTVQALAEGMATAARHGVAPGVFARAVGANACSSPLATLKLPSMADGNFEPHFSLENMLKDSRYVLALAAEADIETPAISAVSARMDELCRAGLGGLDFSALAQPYSER